MRYSTKQGDVGYLEYLHDKPLRVFFEGTEVTGVVMADEDARMIEQVCFDETGSTIVDGGEIKTSMRYGHVRVEPCRKAQS
jgi:hypothetical protein